MPPQIDFETGLHNWSYRETPLTLTSCCLFVEKKKTEGKGFILKSKKKTRYSSKHFAIPNTILTLGSDRLILIQRVEKIKRRRFRIDLLLRNSRILWHLKTPKRVSKNLTISRANVNFLEPTWQPKVNWPPPK